MISPDFRNTENPNLQEAYKTFIIQNHGNTYLFHACSSLLTNYMIGDSLWKDLEMEFSRVSGMRKEMTQVMLHRSDPD